MNIVPTKKGRRRRRRRRRETRFLSPAE